MALREIGEDGSTHDVLHLPHRQEFDATWLLIPAAQRAAIEAEINRRLDELISSPDPNWGSITNTSIEGGRANPATGVRGDWTGTVFQPIYEIACGMNEELAGMFYGNVWKKSSSTALNSGLESAPTQRFPRSERAGNNASPRPCSRARRLRDTFQQRLGFARRVRKGAEHRPPGT